MMFTLTNIGTDSAKDSNARPTGLTDYFTLAYNTQLTSIDAGMHPTTGSIGGKIWLDNNGEGIRDIQESGIANITVRIVNSNGTTIGTTKSDQLGNYVFNGLDPGTSTLKFEPGPLYDFADFNSGFDDDVDSDVKADGTTNQIFTDVQNIWTNVDCGLIDAMRKPLSITLDVYPNPTADAFTPEFKNTNNRTRNITVSMINQRGQTVLSEVKLLGEAIDIQNLDAGVYQVYVMLDGLRYQSHIVKIE